MKRYRITYLLAVLGLLFAAGTVRSQIPRTFSYQGVLTGQNGAPIPDGNHTMTVSLYESATGGVPVHTETQNINVNGGVYGILIGLTPIPTSVTFSKQYWLGVSVDGTQEMTPRTAIVSVPYAMNAATAQSLAPGATGVVTSINGGSGALTLEGGGGTTVTRSGETITITSSGSGGGSGIQGIQNTDGSINVQNPTGPVATVSIANGGIIPENISATGSSAGQALISNGTAVSWQNISGGLTLPFEGSVDNPSSGLTVTTNGKGSAFYGISNSLGSPISGYTTGTGYAGSFVIANESSKSSGLFSWTNGTGSAVEGFASGTGRAGYFHGNDRRSEQDILLAEAHTAGAAFAARQLGSGAAATFYIDSTGNRSPVLRALTNGSGKVIEAIANGTGTPGYFETNNASNSSPAVHGKAEGTNGVGVRAEYAGNGNGNALEINNGYIKVSGTNKTAFIHTTTAQNTTQYLTTLTYPGATSNDILIVTHNYGRYLPSGTTYSVWWNGTSWTIYLDDTKAAMPIGTRFNVLVIKQ